MRTILHVDFNSYFATVEQQANPRLRGKPIGVTGGDRLERTVIGAASVEAKKLGVKTGMHLYEARKICPELILVKGDSDKYLFVTQKFLNILKDYTPYLEVFSIDECFLELPNFYSERSSFVILNGLSEGSQAPLAVSLEIKERIKAEVGEWITCSIGISYNKLMAKLAGSLYKPDGLVVIADEEAAVRILDQVELDSVCGIGFRIKERLNNMGISGFKDLRQVPLNMLLASFKSYGQVLYNMARGIDNSSITPFYLKEEVKSVGHRHTLNHDTDDLDKIKQILLKLTELIARRLRAKKLVGKTVSFWFRYSLASHLPGVRTNFIGDGMQSTISYTNDGLEVFKASFKLFLSLWNGQKIRMVGVSISNLKPENPQNLSFLEEVKRKEVITKALDKINNRYGEFTLQRGVLLQSASIKRMPNPFLADRRFKL